MTTILRRMGIGALIALIGAFLMVGAVAPVAAQDGDCYPVPPGGCPQPEPEPEPEPDPVPPPPQPQPPPPPPVVAAEPLCEDVIQAIADGDTSMDQNGDGLINADDLPSNCSCEELVNALAAGIFEASDLPVVFSNCCEELAAAVIAGDIDAADLPDDAFDNCSCGDIVALITAGILAPSEVADLLSSCCEELAAAVINGDIDPADLPDGIFDDCSCGDIVALVAAGAVDPADVPDLLSSCCEELAAAVINGDIDPDSLPDDVFDDCSCDVLQDLVDAGVLSAAAVEACQPPLPADTGIDAAGLVSLMMFALMGGAVALMATRRRTIF